MCVTFSHRNDFWKVCHRYAPNYENIFRIVHLQHECLTAIQFVACCDSAAEESKTIFIKKK